MTIQVPPVPNANDEFVDYFLTLIKTKSDEYLVVCDGEERRQEIQSILSDLIESFTCGSLYPNHPAAVSLRCIKLVSDKETLKAKPPDWIEFGNLDINRRMELVTHIIGADAVAALTNLLDYNSEEERRSYDESNAEERETHVYRDVWRVAQALGYDLGSRCHDPDNWPD